MRRTALVLLAPTVAVCRFGCASCCAAPITVFWVAGIISIVFGFLGGPVSNQSGISWSTVALGLALWAMASLWTAVSIWGAGKAQCDKPDSSVRPTIHSAEDEPDPFNDTHGAR